MSKNLSKRQNIADVMTGWMHRDLGKREAVRDLLTPEARIEVTWFRGAASDFVHASARMCASQIKTKDLAVEYLVVKGGFDVRGIHPTKGSTAERELKATASTRLKEVTS